MRIHLSNPCLSVPALHSFLGLRSDGEGGREGGSIRGLGFEKIVQKIGKPMQGNASRFTPPPRHGLARRSKAEAAGQPVIAAFKHQSTRINRN
jgi:hypothetical protein